MSNTFGSALRLTVFGQSHAPAIGMCLDGFPAGFAPDFAALNAFLARRAPGNSPCATARAEADAPEFLCGFSGGKTCGAPIAAIVRNTDVRKEDYENLEDVPRPSHADWTAYVKYGESADRAGGGQFSGRLTAPLCVAGGLCLQWLHAQGIRIGAHIQSIGGVRDASFDPLCPTFPAPAPLTVLDSAAGAKMAEEIEKARADGDSVGGSIECAVTGLPVGLGEPMFDGMESRLAQILFAVPAVKGVEFGSGFACASMRGSEHNDAFYYDESGAVRTRTNHAGGILGGLTTAMPLLFRIAVKPTPSIAKPQESVRFSGGSAELRIRGRHDPCIVPRAVPVVEAAAAIAVLDALLEAKG